MSWDDAACRDGRFDPDWWFAAEEHPDTARAVSICGGCPAQFECLAYGTERRLDGVWGGLTYRQRHKVSAGRRRVERAALPLAARTADPVGKGGTNAGMQGVHGTRSVLDARAQDSNRTSDNPIVGETRPVSVRSTATPQGVQW